MLAEIVCPVVGGLTYTQVSGSTLSMSDPRRTEEAPDYFREGTIWFLGGLNVDLCRTISEWIPSTKTFKWIDALPNPVAHNTRYAASIYPYNKERLYTAVNEALLSLNRLPLTNTALTTVARQAQYDLPASVFDLLKVEVATTQANDPEEWMVTGFWQERGGKLIFDSGMIPAYGGHTIRLTYAGRHADLTEDKGVISDYIDPEWLKWQAAVQLLRTQLQVKQGDTLIATLLNEALMNVEKHKAIVTEWKPQRNLHPARW